MDDAENRNTLFLKFASILSVNSTSETNEHLRCDLIGVSKK